MAAKLQAIHLKTLKGHTGAIYTLVSDGAGGFFSASGDGMVVHWHYGAADGKLIANIPGHVYALAFDAEKNLLFAGSSVGELFIIAFNQTQAPSVRRFEAHPKGLFAIHLLADGFVTGGGDGKLLKWNLDGVIERVIDVSDASVRAIIRDQQGQWWVGSSDFKVRVFHPDLTLKTILSGHTQSVFALSVIDSGKVISGGRDATLRVWNGEGSAQATIAAHNLHIHSIKLNAHRPLIASGSMDKTVKIWDASSLELLKVLEASKLAFHRSSVNTLLWLDERLLVSAGDDRTICLTEIA